MKRSSSLGKAAAQADKMAKRFQGELYLNNRKYEKIINEMKSSIE